jgi:hypothetical protein
MDNEHSKDLAQVPPVTQLTKDQYVMCQVDGSMKRITLDNLMNSINAGNEELLREVAWGCPVKQAVQSSQNWGMIGNRDLYAQFKSMVGRYMLKNNGKAAKLSVSNSNFYADGTALDASIGHMVVKAPRLYLLYKVDASTNIGYLWGSMLPIGGFYIDLCVGAMLASIVSGKLVSRPGIAPTTNKTITEFWNAAQANGVNFGLVDYDWAVWNVAMNLFEYGNPNIQANIGNGITGTNNDSDYTTPWSWNLGDTLALGDGCGKVDKAWTNSGGTAVLNACHINFFGQEDPICYWQMMQGIYCGNSGNAGQDGTEVFIYKGNRLPNAAELSTHPAGDYRQITRLTTEGFIKEMILGPKFDIFASVLGGGAGGSSYWGDYQYANSTGQLVLLGGYAYYGSYCGLGYVNSYYAWSYAYATLGSRLAYYGDMEIVDGKDLAAA